MVENEPAVPENEPAVPEYLANFCALHSLEIDLGKGEDPADYCWMISRAGGADLGIFIWRDQASTTKMMLDYLNETLVQL